MSATRNALRHLDATLSHLSARVTIRIGLQTGDISIPGVNDDLSSHARLALHGAATKSARAIGSLPGLAQSGAGGQLMIDCLAGERSYGLAFDCGLAPFRKATIAQAQSRTGLLARRLGSVDWASLPAALPRRFVVVVKGRPAEAILARSAREAAILFAALDLDDIGRGRDWWQQGLERIEAIAETVPAGDWRGGLPAA